MFHLFIKSTLIASLVAMTCSVHAGFLDDLAKTATTNNQAKESKQKPEKSSPLEDLAGLGSVADFAKTGKLDTGALVKELVDKQCRDQLNDRQEWKLISMFMTDEKKAEWETKVCGCATEEAMNATSKEDLIKIANPSTRNETVVKVTETAVKACISRLQ